MVYKSTEEMVQRVMPLLQELAPRTVDKARLLQYLSARAGVDWGVLELVEEREDADPEFGGTRRVITVRDAVSGAMHRIPFPACLDPALDQMVQDEYRRLAMDRPLTTMAAPLFEALYGTSHCTRCRWRGPEHQQIHRECHFAGYPVNFESDQPADEVE